MADFAYLFADNSTFFALDTGATAFVYDRLPDLTASPDESMTEVV